MAAASLAGYARFIEPLRVDVVRTGTTVAAPGLPAAGLRVLHLSDFHFHAWSPVERAKIAAVHRQLAGEAIDLLIISGDVVHDDGGLPAVRALLEGLPEPRLGAFACLGNHDFARYSLPGHLAKTWREGEGRRVAAVREEIGRLAAIVRANGKLRFGVAGNDLDRIAATLAELGVVLLRNESRRVEAGEADIWIAGLDDLIAGRPAIGATLGERPSGSLALLLAHHPDLLLHPLLQTGDVAFCGHVHGGQIRLPGYGALYTGSHLRRDRTSGWFTFGRTRAYVSRGLGESTRLRFNCLPEVTVITLRPPPGLPRKGR